MTALVWCLICDIKALQDEDEPATQALDEDDVVIMRTYGRELNLRSWMTETKTQCPNSVRLALSWVCSELSTQERTCTLDAHFSRVGEKT